MICLSLWCQKTSVHFEFGSWIWDLSEELYFSTVLSCVPNPWPYWPAVMTEAELKLLLHTAIWWWRWEQFGMEFDEVFQFFCSSWIELCRWSQSSVKSLLSLASKTIRCWITALFKCWVHILCTVSTFLWVFIYSFLYKIQNKISHDSGVTQRLTLKENYSVCVRDHPQKHT